MGKIASMLFLMCTMLYSSGQTKTEVLTNVNVRSTKAIRLGKTEPLKDLINVPVLDVEKSKARKKKITARPNFFGRKGSNVIMPELEHQGYDPLRQKETTRNRMTAITPKVNIDGLRNGGRPTDPTGDVGLDYYIQAVNATSIGLYDKRDGSLMLEFTGNALWSAIGESSAGDPIILFDHDEERWIITEFTSPNGSANLLFAISETSDPLGSYFVYSFSPPNFPDYPKWAIWRDTYMVTTNEGDARELHQYFFDRAAFLAGAAEVTMQRVAIDGNLNTEAGFYVTTPVSWTGSEAPVDNNPIAVKINDSSWGEVSADAVELFTFNIDFENGTTVSKQTIETTPFDGYPCDNESGGFACLSQGGSSAGIDAIPEIIMNLPHYRNFGTHESIVLSFITDVDNGGNLSGIRWMELRRTTGDWEVYQEGTYAPDDGLHRFMPSISMDKDGNVGLAYNTTSSSEFIGIRYTGRYVEDPLGQMTVSEFNVVNGTSAVSGDRFGDYAQMAIDPEDGRTFWYTSEYASGGAANTRIVSFQLERNEIDLEVISIDEPVTSSSLTNAETVIATVQNNGKTEVSGFDLILSVDDEVIETYTHSASVASGATYQHSFATTIDLEAFGAYVVSVEVVTPSDEVPGNNKVLEIIEKIAEVDAAVSIDALTEVCSESIDVVVEITNNGENILTSADVELYLNNVLQETISWTGSLERLSLDTEVITIGPLAEGNNEIRAEVISANGSVDVVSTNNTATIVSDLDDSFEQITLTINTDRFPDETTWELQDSNESTVLQGGPYSDESTEITETLCVDPNACYTFIIRDAFDDGICCEFGNGSYSISSESGSLIFESSGQFTSSESTTFCVGTECNLDVDVSVVDETNDELGSLVISASGSFGYTFSIDGGSTFQNSSVFDGLEKGSYEVRVEAQDGNCIFEETVNVDFECSLSINIDQIN
ncbi:MAG: hypothetical protein AAFY41_03545, partial [Bacteroidota bacterium]